MSGLTHFSLFTGIGGIDLAAEWAGFRSVGQCEYADYPTKVLEKHWPDVPRWRDVCDVTRDDLLKNGIEEITLLSGGFPCQPHSCAGKRLASGDERDLWGEFARIIREVKPRWVLGENVPGLLTSEDGRFFGRVLRDLADAGYHAGWGVFSAFHVGGCHKRERVFIVAHTAGLGRNSLEEDAQIRCLAHDLEGIQPPRSVNSRDTNAAVLRILSNPISGLHRNDDGIPSALDRLKCHGNAVMPQQALSLLVAIAAAERSFCNAST